MVRKEISKDKALERLILLCNKSEQCEFDLYRKMLNWRIPSIDRKEILEYLKENKLLDDRRFANAYANDKARFSSWGPQKIRAELILRKIKSNFIKEALGNIDSQIWKEGLRRCALSKSKGLDLVGEEAYTNYQKLFRYLISRGFPSGAVSKVINLIKQKSNNNDIDMV